MGTFKRIYFKMLDGSYVTNIDIAKAYFVMTGKKVDNQDLDIIKEIAKKYCDGVLYHYDSITVNDLIKSNQEVQAIQFLTETYHIGVVEAKREVEKIKAELTNEENNER